MIWFSRGIVLFLLCLAPVFHADRVQAMIHHVPGDLPSIQEGLDASAAGDTVLLACGTYLEYNITMKAGVTLLGESSNVACVVIDAQNQGRILDCVDLTTLTVIEGITFSNGYTTEGWFTALGGGIRCLNSNVAITNCSFQNNNARIGAGVGLSESTIEMKDCTFTSNHAIHFDWAAGGAIWARDCSGSIENCDIITNTAFSENAGNPGDGGGFFFNNCDLEVTDSLFQNNSTGAGAGAFYSVTTDSSVFTNCDFVDNIAANGGAVYYEYGAAAQLVNCTFTNNIATAGGAIVTFNDSNPTVINCLFEGNEATQWGGGAIDGWSSVVTISGSTFRNNQAQTHGGAANFGDCNVVISNSIFDSNRADGLGGAIRAHYANVTTNGCTMVENSASEGAGIYCGTNSYATVNNSIIAYSPSGESMAGLVSGFASISCSDFFGNNGGDWVGDIANQLTTENNFSADPMFCNPSQNDFSISNISQCAPEYQESCGLIGALDVGCTASGPVVRELLINEFLATNSSGHQDETGAYEDWVELFNPSNSAINLAGLFLSNNIREPMKWPLPEIEIPAGGFLVVFCDNEPEDGPLHASFELDANGGDISLFDGNANQYCDSRYFETQETDISEGRQLDGNNFWINFPNPTPGFSNASVSAISPTPFAGSSIIISNYPNPFNPRTTIMFQLAKDSQTTISVFNVRGQLLRTLLDESLSSGEHQITWNGQDHNGQNVGSGPYFVQLRTSGIVDTKRIMLIK